MLSTKIALKSTVILNFLHYRENIIPENPYFTGITENYRRTHVSRIVMKGDIKAMNKENEIPDFRPIRDKRDLAQINGYEIESVSESTGNSESKSTNIFLKQELPDGRTVHREFMIVANGDKFITDEY